MRIYGPATITHNSVNVGKTSQGGSFQLNTVEWRTAGPLGSIERVSVSGEGVINLFELAAGYSLTYSQMWKDYGELKFVMPDSTLVFPSAKLFYPESLEFGINALKVLKVKFTFRKVTAANLFTLS